jgi:hypothetical protein
MSTEIKPEKSDKSDKSDLSDKSGLKLQTVGKAYIITGEETRSYKDSIKQYAIWSREHRGWLIPQSRGGLATEIYNLISEKKTLPTDLKIKYQRQAEPQTDKSTGCVESINESVLKNLILNLESTFNNRLDLLNSKFESMFQKLESRLCSLEDFADTTREIINNM